MSAGSPSGAPASTQRTTRSICSSLSEMSLTNCWMPTVLSRCQGGISRAITRFLIARAQGRVSAYVTSDIGAMLPSRWHVWQCCCRSGAMSRANVTSGSAAVWARPAAGAAAARPASTRIAAADRPCDTRDTL